MSNKPMLESSSSDCSGGGADPGRVAELLAELKSLLANEQQLIQEHWNRSLPFADYIVNRWEKAKSLGFGNGSSIYDSALVLGDVTVGEHTWIGPFTVLDGSGGGLVIGDYCSISAGVQIYTHDSVRWATSGGNAEIEKAPTRIGSNCYIAPNVIIAKGVTIGNTCIIGANSVVLNCVPSGSRAFGNPCKSVSLVDLHES